MCGRYTHLYTWRQLHRLMTLTSPQIDLPMRYNVAPMQHAPVVRAVDAGHRSSRAVSMLQWGLVPSWAKDPAIGGSLINARSETAATKPAFRSSFGRRRCIVPVSGFYEWLGPKGTKGRQPFYVSPRSSTAPDDGGDILAFAGLWEAWLRPEGEPLESFVILTTDANEWMRPLHDRMPVILAAADFDPWLDPSSTADRLGGLLHPAREDLLQRWPVSTLVNRPGRDDPSMIESISEQGFTNNLFG